MAVIPNSSALKQASLSHPIQNPGNTAPPPVIGTFPTPAPVMQAKLYDQRFPKKFMVTLSLIQLVMAVLAILMQAVGSSTSYPGGLESEGAEIWCGIVVIFFALSGVFGLIACSKPSFGWIVTFMVFSIISASFCLPLLVLSSIRTAITYHYFGHVVSAIQIAISLIQAAVAIVSAGMTCRAVCKCCGPRRECNAVCYNGSEGCNPNQTMPEQQRAYITIPISQIEVFVASAGATEMPTMSMIPVTTDTDGLDNSPPPEYEIAAKMEEDKKEENVGTSQRF